MSGLDVVKWIRQLDENAAVDLARQLIFTEASRLDLPLGDQSMSGRVKVADQGVDGRTNFPQGTKTLWPTGRCVWQVKSGSTSPSATKEFDELKHGHLIDAIRDGCDYVLFWTSDPVDPTADAVRKSFMKAAKAIRDDVQVHLLFADEIERMCGVHLAILARMSPLRVGGLIAHTQWAQNHGDVQFQVDPSRAEFITLIRQHANSTNGPADLHILGDSGVGKSRLVFEALDHQGTRERVLIAPYAQGFDGSLIADVVATPGQTLILVVDESEPEDRRRLARIVALAEGRIRLITMGGRRSRDSAPVDSRYLELLPLAVEASKQIAVSLGLRDSDAELVARYTEGYPGLARDLAMAMLYGESSASVAKRVRGHDQLGLVLAALVPTDAIEPLGIIAMFERLGFDAEFGQELSTVCSILRVDESEVRRIADRELGKLISQAGRYRRVSPRILAIWLATRYLEAHRGTLQSALKELPDGLREHLLTQMRDVGDDPNLQRALTPLLESEPFVERGLARVDEGAARLLHVGAIVSPQVTMDAIARVMHGVNAKDLRKFKAGRRDVVSALQLLLWGSETFNDSADILMRLAIAENELWSNNSTGVVQGLFGVHLGGTDADFSIRLTWARSMVEMHGAESLPILVPALGYALTAFESRMAPDFGGRSVPAEWRPSSLAEDREARAGAWAFLIELLTQYPKMEAMIVEALVSGIRTMLERGSVDLLLDQIEKNEWSPVSRAALAESLRHAISYDELPGDVPRRISGVIAHLEGTTSQSQLDFVVSQPIWQLSEDREEVLNGRPAMLLQVADSVRKGGLDEILTTAERTRQANRETTATLFRILGEGVKSEEALGRLEVVTPTPDAALLGFFAGMAHERSNVWAVARLKRWLDSDLRDLVISAVHQLPASDETLQVALESVERGSPSANLARFLYGGWAQPLSVASLKLLVEKLVDEPNREVVENALGILNQWIDVRGHQIPAELIGLASSLLMEASTLSGARGDMLDFYRERVLDAVPMVFTERLPAFIRSLERLQSFPTEPDLRELDRLLAEDPAKTAEVVSLRLIASMASDTYEPWLTWMDGTKILTRISEGGGRDKLLEVLMRDCPKRLWPRLLAHIDFSRDAPDPVFVQLLEKAPDEDVSEVAQYRFTHPESVSWGSESDVYRSRIAAATVWMESTPDLAESVRNWLQGVTRALEEALPEILAREAERGF